MSTAALELSGLRKQFGALVAVRDFDVTLGAPRITGLIGPNGSGKTTLINLIGGLLRPTSGSIRWNGRDITRRSAHLRPRIGISRTFQQSMTFPELTVRDNLRIASEATTRRRQPDPFESDVYPDHLLDSLEPYAGASGRNLPFGIARLLGIGIAMASRPQLLLLDEPAAGLSEAESETLADVLRKIAASSTALVVVDHNMPFLMPLCSRVVVMDAGGLIADATPAEVRANPKVIEIYLGGGSAQAH